MKWQPIETAPRDGSTFLICRAGEGFDSYEVGRYEPWMHKTYEPVEGGLFREVMKPIFDWRGFDNMHRATHWAPLPEPPVETQD